LLTPGELVLRVPDREEPVLEVPRGSVGAARVTSMDSGTSLNVDVGIERKSLDAASSLKAPELEWLARAIEAWRDGG